MVHVVTHNKRNHADRRKRRPVLRALYETSVMNNLLKLIGITCISLHCNAEQIVPVHWYSEEIEHCGRKLTKHIYKLNNSDKLSEKTTFKETEDTFKRKDLILKPLCTIGNPAISDGIRYTIISFSKKTNF